MMLRNRKVCGEKMRSFVTHSMHSDVPIQTVYSQHEHIVDPPFRASHDDFAAQPHPNPTVVIRRVRAAQYVQQQHPYARRGVATLRGPEVIRRQSNSIAMSWSCLDSESISVSKVILNSSTTIILNSLTTIVVDLALAA